MKTVNAKNVVAQGDVMFIRVEEDMPRGKPVLPTANGFIVAHSETGHHHILTTDGRAELVEVDPFTCYLRMDMDGIVTHHRAWDTHAPVGLSAGTWKIKRQREYTPQGFRRVED